MKFITLLLLSLSISLEFSFTAAAQDRILQILHVNDIHSYWESSEHHRHGGLARVKTLMDKLETEGNSKGWVTLRLDAGDFTDGNLDFLADSGKVTFLLEKAMGFDAVALGNHDYLTGIDDLVGRALDPEQRLPLVAANFIDPQDTGVSPGRVIDRGGLKISIGGATVVSTAYNWAAWPAQFTSPLHSLESWFQSHPGDIRIALTHIGVSSDRKLARHSRDIDVIVGGHSHTLIPQPEFYLSKSKEWVPVVQVGCHGIYLGQMVIKIAGPGNIQVLSYTLHEITPDIPEDPKIAQMVAHGRQELAEQLNSNLGEVVAQASEDFYTHQGPNPLIGNFFADAMKDAAHTEIAVDSGQLYADSIDSGPLTTGDILNLEPHLYSWTTRGWHIYRCEARPVTLAAALSVLARSQLALGVAGMDLKMAPLHLVTDMKVNGQPMKLNKVYSLALSEGFADALFTRRGLENMLCSNLQDTGILVRDALLQKAKTLKILSSETLGPPRVHHVVLPSNP